MNETQKAIFDRLNDGSRIGNPATTMNEVLSQPEAKDWGRAEWIAYYKLASELVYHN